MAALISSIGLSHHFHCSNSAIGSSSKRFRRSRAEFPTTMQSVTYAASEMYVKQGRSPKDVAAFLGISLDSVYVDKNRCTKILMDIVRNLGE